MPSQATVDATALPSKALQLDDAFQAEGPCNKGNAHVNLLQVQSQTPQQITRSRSALHDVVGEDGVKVITLKRMPERFYHSAQFLQRAGIQPKMHEATDAQTSNMTPDSLSHVCTPQSEKATKSANITKNSSFQCGRENASGKGCSFVEQSIADSYYRALVEAKNREQDWTAIMEDDVIPVQMDGWDRNFKLAWEALPPSARLVRLTWCGVRDWIWYERVFNSTAGKFYILKYMGDNSQHYLAGGCFAAFIVHRNVIPQMLNVFPCCMQIDTCFERDLFDAGFGMKYMYYMDINDWKRDISTGWSYGWQRGVMFQDLMGTNSTYDHSVAGRKKSYGVT